MHEFRTVVYLIISSINIYAINAFGLLAPLLWLNIVLMFLDLITRILAAHVTEHQQVSSKKCFKGIYKKIGMCILIFLSLIMDNGLIKISVGLGLNIPTKVLFSALVLAWIFIRELISNIENLVDAGVEIPQFLLKNLDKIKNEIDKK